MAVFGRSRNPVYRFGERSTSAVMPPNPFTFAMLSHTGRVRKGNEDTCAASPSDGAFLVCDGMGGAAAGEVASRLAAQAFLAQLAPSATDDTLRRATPDIRLRLAIHDANQSVFRYAERRPELRGMGTTLVALLIEHSEPGPHPTGVSLTLAHVGDSRCYLLRAGRLIPLTHDHSLVEEQLLAGQITALEAQHHPLRNIITRAVGSQPEVEPDICHLDPLPGDLYLLASDGLTRDLTNDDIAAILQRTGRSSPPSLPALCQALVDEANDAGGGDNITVLLLQLP